MSGRDDRPVAFRVKDFADGWVYFDDEKSAMKEALETGGILQSLYVRTAGVRLSYVCDDNVTVASPDPEAA